MRISAISKRIYLIALESSCRPYWNWSVFLTLKCYSKLAKREIITQDQRARLVPSNGERFACYQHISYFYEIPCILAGNPRVPPRASSWVNFQLNRREQMKTPVIMQADHQIFGTTSQNSYSLCSFNSLNYCSPYFGVFH